MYKRQGQRSQLWWDVPVTDSFALLRDIYRVDEARYRKNVEELTELLDLGELLRTPARQLSLGQRMRCEIAASLLHDPKVLFLDEPTIGLDAVSKLAVRSFIRERNRTHGTTVLLTTHDMQAVSYTHLDVYKRQVPCRALRASDGSPPAGRFDAEAHSA